MQLLQTMQLGSLVSNDERGLKHITRSDWQPGSNGSLVSNDERGLKLAENKRAVEGIMVRSLAMTSVD